MSVRGPSPVNLSSSLNVSHEGVSVRIVLFNIPVALSVQLLPAFVMTAVDFRVPRHHVHTCGPHQPPTEWTSACHFSCGRATICSQVTTHVYVVPNSFPNMASVPDTTSIVEYST
jgi:hypothetical protein